MSILQTRILLFIFGCVLTRIALIYLAKTANKVLLKWMGYIALVPATGFLFIYLTGSRKTGAETFGQKIWWNHLRPVHSLLYFLFAYFAILGNNNSWIYLAIDLFIGVTAFIGHHFM